MYDPPSLFSTLWAMLTPFMETKTANKVKFLKKKAARDKLAEYVDLGKLEQSVGGDLSYEFDFGVSKCLLTLLMTFCQGKP